MRALWVAHGERLSESQIATRLAAVLCVHRDRDGRVDGVNSATPTRIPLIGNQELWVYRGIGVGVFDPPMIGAAFNTLERAYSGSGPVGLYVACDTEMQSKYPQLRWDDPPLLHAGFAPDGHQLRVAYFAAAHVVHGAGRASL